jgi:hypothetical protein
VEAPPLVRISFVPMASPLEPPKLDIGLIVLWRYRRRDESSLRITRKAAPRL